MSDINTACKGHSYSAKRRRVKDAVSASWQAVIAECSTAQYGNDGNCPPSAASHIVSSYSCTTTSSATSEHASCSTDADADDKSADSDCDGHCSDDGDVEAWSPACSSPSSESDSNTGCHRDEPSLTSQLASWKVNHNITLSALHDLLAILRPHHPGLPCDPRTLLQTPRNYHIREISTQGQYFHFGIAAGIQSLDLSLVESDVLKLQFNIDGLPLFKSSSTEFWPILCLVKHTSTAPFVVGLYSGKGKPSCLNEFLGDFVSDVQTVLRDGVSVNGCKFGITVDCFICDAPARAYVKNVKYHSGYFGCDKCTQEGKYVDGRMTFPVSDATLRTDSSFAGSLDEDHHRGPTPLSALNIGLVTSFALDYMHLVCLGVMRKLLHFWVSGPICVGGNVASRLPASSVRILSARLQELSSHLPREFARKPRSLSEMDRWKATEYRTFLMYTGPVVLDGILPDKIFHHFLLLSTAITILASERMCVEFNDYAAQLLVSFVDQAKQIYGPTFLVYNVHALVHLAAEVRRYGPLDAFSAFPFESQLGSLKRLVRKGSSPLSQVLRRVCEQRHFQLNTTNAVVVSHTLEAYKPHTSGPLPHDYPLAQQFSRLRKGNTVISATGADSYVIVEGKGPMLVRNVLQIQENTMLVCSTFPDLKNLFTYPLPSENLGIVTAAEAKKKTVIISASSPLRKCVCLPRSWHSRPASFVIIPLVHLV